MFLDGSGVVIECSESGSGPAKSVLSGGIDARLREVPEGWGLDFGEALYVSCHLVFPIGEVCLVEWRLLCGL